MATNKIDASKCFVCGKNNNTGLQIEFRMEKGMCLGQFHGHPNLVGFGDVIHGGIIYSILDDAMANWFYLQGEIGYTAKADIRYRSPMRVGDTGLVRSQLITRKGKLLVMKSDLIIEETKSIIAECEGKFILSTSDSYSLKSN